MFQSLRFLSLSACLCRRSLFSCTITRHLRQLQLQAATMTPLHTPLPTLSVPHALEPAEDRPNVSASPGTPLVHSFFEPKTSTWQYVVADPATLDAVIIDPVLDFDSASGKVTTEAADGILDFITKNGLNIRRILETHAHADHLTASQYLKQKLPGNVPVCIGERIKQVQQTFAPLYGLDSSSLSDSFDILLKDEEEYKLGELSCRVIHLPGHTPDHVGYILGKSVFTGDSIFMPDVGSARCDFPGGNAKDLFSSMQRLLALPDDYRLYVGHDYPSNRDPTPSTTVAEQRKLNKHGKQGTTESMFVEFREARDAVLGAPKLLHPALQVNIRAGRLPPSDSSGRIPMKIPA